jgi:hypothetical protein
MDLDEAILFRQLVNAAYAVAPDNLTNRAGEIVPAGLDGNQTTYQVLTSIYANDLATDVNQLRGTLPFLSACSFNPRQATPSSPSAAPSAFTNGSTTLCFCRSTALFFPALAAPKTVSPPCTCP